MTNIVQQGRAQNNWAMVFELRIRLSNAIEGASSNCHHPQRMSKTRRLSTVKGEAGRPQLANSA
jgi:hypothetical protein